MVITQSNQSLASCLVGRFKARGGVWLNNGNSAHKASQAPKDSGGRRGVANRPQPVLSEMPVVPNFLAPEESSFTGSWDEALGNAPKVGMAGADADAEADEY